MVIAPLNKQLSGKISGVIHEPNLRIGIDIGGTFTDFVIFDPVTTQIRTFKILSTPEDPSLAVLKGLERLKIPTYDNSSKITIHFTDANK